MQSLVQFTNLSPSMAVAGLSTTTTTIRKRIREQKYFLIFAIIYGKIERMVIKKKTQLILDGVVNYVRLNSLVLLI